MIRQKTLSKTKTLRRQLREAKAQNAANAAALTLIKARSQDLERRLHRLVGSSFTYNPDHRRYTVAIDIDQHALRHSGTQVIEDALLQLFAQAYEADARILLPDYQSLLQEIQRHAANEFDRLLHPVIRQIDRERPPNEPHIMSHTYFRLAKRFLAAFIQMASVGQQRNATPGGNRVHDKWHPEFAACELHEERTSDAH